MVDHTIEQVKLTKLQNKKTAMNFITAWVDAFIRRLMDIALSLTGMLILSPFIMMIVMMIKNDSPGPVLYRGPRAGKNGKIFQILKFRTMYENPASYKGAKVTAQDDPRITPIGKFLRETKLNELPQLWNVFIGDMSLVGPRPEDPHIVEGWSEEDKRIILSVKPGITSPASVLYRNEESMLQSRNVMDRYLWDILPSKLRLDKLYVRNRNILSDLDVLFWTAVALLPRSKNFQVPERLLYRGPLSLLVNRFVSWFIIDFSIAFLAITFAGILRRLSSPLDLGFEKSTAIALVMALLFSLINTIMGVNKTNWSRATIGEALDLAVSTFIVTSVLFVVNLIVPNGPVLPPIVVVTSGMFAFTGFMFVRYRERLIASMAERWINMRRDRIDILTEPVLIIGAGELANFAVWLLRYGPLSKAFKMIGIVDDDPKKIGQRIEGLEVIGHTEDIPELIKKYDIGMVLFAIADINPEDTERIVSLCNLPEVRVIMIPDVMDSLRAHFPANESERETLVGKVVRNSTLDRLTGIHNKQSFLRMLERELPRAHRYGHPCSIIVFDIKCNWPGGVQGSKATMQQVLQIVVDRVLKNIREIDLLGRYDDHEFVILLPETDLEAANRVAERLHKNLCCSPITTNNGDLGIDVTFGVVSQDSDSLDAEVLIKKAVDAVHLLTSQP